MKQIIIFLIGFLMTGVGMFIMLNMASGINKAFNDVEQAAIKVLKADENESKKVDETEYQKDKKYSDNKLVLNFKQKEAGLDDSMLKALNAFLNTYGKDWSYKISSYTDNVGTAEYNMKIAQKRADGIGQLMQEYGIPVNNISISSYGKRDNIVPNDTEENRAKNRRVEIMAYKDGE
jgi:outer membrane protein OmpA-like peptidoglycan-associated protein